MELRRAGYKKTLIIEDYRGSLLEGDFKIKQIINTTKYNIEDMLTESHIEGLIRQGYNITIKPIT